MLLLQTIKELQPFYHDRNTKVQGKRYFSSGLR